MKDGVLGPPYSHWRHVALGSLLHLAGLLDCSLRQSQSQGPGRMLQTRVPSSSTAARWPICGSPDFRFQGCQGLGFYKLSSTPWILMIPIDHSEACSAVRVDPLDKRCSGGAAGTAPGGGAGNALLCKLVAVSRSGSRNFSACGSKGKRA